MDLEISFLPHETDCTMYYECNKGVITLRTCDSQMHWNAQLNQCDNPENANCTLGMTTVTSTPSTTTSSTTSTSTSTPSTTTSLLVTETHELTIPTDSTVTETPETAPTVPQTIPTAPTISFLSDI